MLPPILSVQAASDMRRHPLAVAQRLIDILKDHLNLYGKVEFELPALEKEVQEEVLRRLDEHFEAAGYIREHLKDTHPNRMQVRPG
jgi:hypothetical protein